MRSALDVLAVRKAAKRLRGRCEPLRKCVAAIVDAAKRRDFVAFQQHNQSFHRYILEQAGNAALLRVYDSLAFEVRARAIMDFLVSDDPVDIAREHEAIVDAARARRRPAGGPLRRTSLRGIDPSPPEGGGETR